MNSVIKEMACLKKYLNFKENILAYQNITPTYLKEDQV